MTAWHLITCEFPPMVGGVSEHSRVLAEEAAARGLDVHVWTPGGARPLPGVQIHDTLGSFGPADLARSDAALDRYPPPRRVVLQWVPHGYGRRGINVGFARWIRRRARAGDAIDVIVHEPFVDFIGGSWRQPAQAVIQRYMTRTVVKAARRVWLSIPAWQRRVGADVARPARVLPIPGTIPVSPDPDALSRRAQLANGAPHVVGYFGAGGDYVERALAQALTRLLARRADVMVVCLGRGSDAVAARLATLDASPGVKGTGEPRVRGTGELSLRELSHALQACDVLVQPYIDGVSGRRTTTISALEHGVPVATTFGPSSESFWRDSPAVETVPVDAPGGLADAVETLLAPTRLARARSAARTLYATHFEPRVVLEPLFAD